MKSPRNGMLVSRIFITLKYIYRELTSTPPSMSLSGKVLKHINFPFLALFWSTNPNIELRHAI